MDIDREALSRIKELLKANPRGMNVTEIAHGIGMNRFSTGKYLEMLVISGHIDVKAFGPSKVYYLSHRMPISAMLSLSSDFIIVLDRDLRIVNVNDRFLEFTGMNRADILYQKFEMLSFPINFNPPITAGLVAALGGKELFVEASYNKKEREHFFNIKFIPLVFDDGQKGVTLLFEDITERKLIELAVKESELKLRRIIEQSRDGVTLTDEHGLIIEYNNGAEAIFGVSRDKAIGMYIWDFQALHDMGLRDNPERLAKVKSMILKVLKTGVLSEASHLRETDIVRSDSKLQSIQVSNFSIKTEKGYMLCGIIRDISERKRTEEALRSAHDELEKIVDDRTLELNVANESLRLEILEKTRAEEELRESEFKYRIVADNTSDWEFWMGTNGQIIYMSPSCENITGYAAEEFVKDSCLFTKVIHPDDRQRFEYHLINESRRALPGNLEYRIITRAGETRWMHHICKPILDTSGRFIGTRGCNRDITERRHAEEALIYNEARYRAFFDNSMDALLLTTPDGSVIAANPAACSIFGMTEEEIKKAGRAGLVDPSDTRFATLLQEREKTGHYLGEVRCRRKDGTTFPTEHSSGQFTDNDGHIYNAVIIRDMTTRK